MSTFVAPDDLDPVTLARSSDINAIKSATTTAFGLLPSNAKINEGKINYAVDTGVVNAYVVAIESGVTSYTDGLLVDFRPLNSNTGAATINVNGLGVKSIKLMGGEALTTDDIISGAPISARYSTATGFFHISPNSGAKAGVATAQAVIATTKASEASASAASALSSQNSATASASTATTKASEASSSASSASTDAATATTQAGIATAQASAASTSASTATTQATTATTQSGIATTKAGEALTSANNAATSEANAAASYDSFDDRYLGSKAEDPTLDNDGNALLEGALYWNSVSKQMRAYDGAAWQVAYLPSGTYVVGPASATDSRIVVFDGATGKIIKDGGKLISELENPTEASQAEMIAGTEATLRSTSPLRVRQAVLAGGMDAYKIANFTAEVGGTYNVNTSLVSPTPLQALMPASPTLGDVVTFRDPLMTWAANNLILVRNGDDFLDRYGVSTAQDLVCDVAGFEISLFFNGTNWKLV